MFLLTIKTPAPQRYYLCRGKNSSFQKFQNMECRLFVKWIYLAIALSGFDSSCQDRHKMFLFSSFIPRIRQAQVSESKLRWPNTVLARAFADAN